MALTKCNAAVNQITLLDDEPALSAEQLKAKFDAAGAEIKTYLNDTLTEEIEAAIPQIVNDLSTGGADKTASAETVKTLNTLVTSKQKAITSGTAAPSGGSSGDIYLRYS